MQKFELRLDGPSAQLSRKKQSLDSFPPRGQNLSLHWENRTLVIGSADKDGLKILQRAYQTKIVGGYVDQKGWTTSLVEKPVEVSIETAAPIVVAKLRGEPARTSPLFKNTAPEAEATSPA